MFGPWRTMTLVVAAWAVFAVALDDYHERAYLAKRERKKKGTFCHRLFKKNLISALTRKRIDRGMYLSREGMNGDDFKCVVYIVENMWRVPDEDIDWEKAAQQYETIAKSPWTDREIHKEYFRVIHSCVSTAGKQKLLCRPGTLKLWNERVRLWGENDERVEKP